MAKDCLILIDLQNDFMPGGPLAVPRGDEVIEVANRLAQRFEHVWLTQDWHPENHLSFASQHHLQYPGAVVKVGGVDQILWEDHCVQGTGGAEFHDGLHRLESMQVVRKGSHRELDSYSGFFDNARRRSTDLDSRLRSQGIDAVTLMGLATDYCVKFTALDAVSLGFETRVVEEGCRGIDRLPGDVGQAWDEMRSAGVEIVSERDAFVVERAGALREGRFLRMQKKGAWEYVERIGVTDVAVLVPVTREDEIVLVEQDRPPLRSPVIELPAGLVGDEAWRREEGLLAGAHRELEEETGYRAGRMDVLARVPTSAGLTSEVVTFLHATDLEKVGPGGGVDEEDIKVHVVPISAVGSWLREAESHGRALDPKIFAGLYLIGRSGEPWQPASP